MRDRQRGIKGEREGDTERDREREIKEFTDENHISGDV